jgi:multiple sugar transport system substrate-binding protein
MTNFSSSSRFSRRQFLNNAALTAGTLAGAGALLNACDASTGGNSSSAGGKTTLTIMGNPGEITPAYIKEFEKLNPTVKINFLTFDQTRLNAMFVAGTPPDIIRGYGFDNPANAARGLALSLDSYLAKSSVLKASDLEPIQDLWRWDGKQAGQGPYYGLAKDWSLDGTLWANNTLVKSAGLAPLSTTTPMTYDDLLAVGKKLTVKQGGKIQVYGVDAEWPNSTSFGTANLYQMIAQQGGSVFSTDLKQADFTTPEAVKALQWYVDYAQAHIGPSPFDPDPNGWDGPTYLAKRMALAMDGFWFSGEVTSGSAEFQNNSVLLPAPVMGSKRISSCFAGTGLWIAAKSQHPDLAWKFFEYFFAGTPAHDRAKGGWGTPGLKSFLPEVPQTLPNQKEAYQATQAELQYFAVLPVSPYTTSAAVGTVIDKYLQQTVKNQLSLSNAAKQITSDVNNLLQQGAQSVG